MQSISLKVDPFRHPYLSLLTEKMNTCHNPAGDSKGGEFCSGHETSNGLPEKKWVDPPAPRNENVRGKSVAGGYTASGYKNTTFGDAVETAVKELGLVNLHEGKRQGPMDLAWPGNKQAFELKAIDVDASEYKLKLSAKDQKNKNDWCKANGYTPGVMMAVVDTKTGACHVYSKCCVVDSSRLSKNSWTYHGSVTVKLPPKKRGELEKSVKNEQGWIGVDLDGTLAKIQHPFNPKTIGEPVPEMIKKVMRALAQNEDIRIFTARIANHPESIMLIRQWCREHIGRVLPVTNKKDHLCKEIWDDRARQVIRDQGVFKGVEDEPRIPKGQAGGGRWTHNVNGLPETTDFNKGGFISTDGKLRDTSMGGETHDLHSEAAGGHTKLYTAMKEGIVRINPAFAAIEAWKEPNAQQYSQLRKVIDHFASRYGKVQVSLMVDGEKNYKSFGRDVTPQKVIDHIHSSFAGEKRYESPLAEFHKSVGILSKAMAKTIDRMLVQINSLKV